MKKNYFLTLVLTLVTTLSFGQIVTNGDFETWSGGVLGTWTSEEGTTITQETATTHGGSNAAKFVVTTQTQGNTDFRQTINVTAGKVYDVSVWVYQADNGARARLYFAGYQGYSDPEVLNSWQEVTYEYTATATGTVDIGLRFYDTSNWSAAGEQSTIYIDDYTVTERVSTTPTLTLTSPTDGSSFGPGTTSVNVEWVTDNVTSETVDIIVNGTRTTGVSSPYSVTTTDGESYSVSLELLDGTNVVANASTTFSIGSTSQVATIAELRAGTEGNFYNLTGNVVVIYDNSGNRNQRYIQDASGAILIDDPNGNMTTAYAVGDQITGIEGELDSFGGVLQFRPTKDSGAPTASGLSFAPVVVSMADYIADVAKSADAREYESMFITLEGVTFPNADGTAVFSTSSRNNDITDGTDTMVMRVNFNDADYIDTVIPTAELDLTGLGGSYNGTAQIFPTALSGFVLDAAKNQIEGFGVYPNPVVGSTFALRTASANTKNVAIFNVLGKQVLNTNVEGNNANVNIAGLNTGIYIVKVTENGKTATKKLVIK